MEFSIQQHKRIKKYINIKLNIKRRTIIVDDQLVFHKSVRYRAMVELSIIDVCNRSCIFCPKSKPEIAPDTYQKMKMPLIDKPAKDLKNMGFKGSILATDTENLYCIKRNLQDFEKIS